MRTITTIGKFFGEQLHVEFDDSEIRIWDDGSEITITGDDATAENAQSLREILMRHEMFETDDADRDLTSAWEIIEEKTRWFFSDSEVEINA